MAPPTPAANFVPRFGPKPYRPEPWPLTRPAGPRQSPLSVQDRSLRSEANVEHADGAAQTPGERPRDGAIELVSRLRVASQRIGQFLGSDHEQIDALERRHGPAGDAAVDELRVADGLPRSEQHRGCLSALRKRAHRPAPDDIERVRPVRHGYDGLTGGNRDLLRRAGHDLHDVSRDGF